MYTWDALKDNARSPHHANPSGGLAFDIANSVKPSMVPTNFDHIDVPIIIFSARLQHIQGRVFSWSRQCIAVVLRMFLLSALRAPSAIGKMKCSPLFGVIISFALSLRAWISDASNFSSSSLSAQIDGVLTGRNRMTFHHAAKRNYWSFEWFSKSPFVKCFSLTRGLEHFADNSNTPQNRPTIFHPSQIATAQQKFLL